MKGKTTGEGTKAKPWKLKTPSGSSDYEMYRAEDADPPAIVCMVGKTELRYRLQAIAGFPDHLKRRFIFQHSAETAAHQRVIINQ